MKVFLSVTSLRSEYGGPAYSVSRLATSLAHEGVEIGLWASDGSVATTPLLDHLAPVRRLTGTTAEALRSFGNPDVIHDNGIWMPHNHQLAVIAAGLGVPRVVSTRGMLEVWAVQHKWMKKRIAWWLYQRRDLAIAQCHHASGEPERATIEQLRLSVPISVVPSGIDIPQLDFAKGKSEHPNLPSSGLRTALFLGRIYPVKGLPMLVEAWSRVRPSGWRLEIAGPDEGGHRAVVERAVSAAGLGEHVSFLGSLGDEAKRSRLLDADFFILPTHSESFGIAIAEALAHSLPVLTTKNAPWSVLEDHDCGWWVDATVDGIAGGLRQATSVSAAELAKKGARGRELVARKFQWREVARQFISIYDRLVQSGIGHTSRLAEILNRSA